MTSFSDQQQMLTLALIAYQGFFLPGDAEATQDGALTARVAEALATLAPVKGRFQLCWGPSAYRPSLAVFDDAMMFVVRDTALPSRYVVVVRGTNPASITDWLFGNLWADRSVPWPHARETAPEARISLSTSLGLSTLQSLHAPQLGPCSFGFETAVLEAGVNALLGPLDEALAGPLREIRHGVHALAEDLLPRSAVARSDAAIEVAERRSSACWAEIKAAVAKAMDVAGERVQFDLYRFLHRRVELRRRSASGIDLATFLRSVTDSGPAEIWVTGHSKGAALASTLALWLAETQGSDLPEGERWDPDRGAVVHCLSFAGPTSGNEAFAARSDEIIGDRCHRVANTLDVVPEGWLFEGLNRTPALYGDRLPAPRLFRELAFAAAHEIRDLGYRHVGKQITTFEGAVQADLSFMEQIAYQHMEAYVASAGLGPYLTREQILGV